MAGQKSPEGAGRNSGVQLQIFAGQFFFAGLFAGHFVGLNPAGFSPAKNTAKGTVTRILTLLAGENAYFRQIVRCPKKRKCLC